MPNGWLLKCQCNSLIRPGEKKRIRDIKTFQLTLIKTVVTRPNQFWLFMTFAKCWVRNMQDTWKCLPPIMVRTSPSRIFQRKSWESEYYNSIRISEYRVPSSKRISYMELTWKASLTRSWLEIFRDFMFDRQHLDE